MPIQMAAASKSVVTTASLFQRRNGGDAITALPSPIPRMNDIRTMANDWSDEPKSSDMAREANTSNPIDTPPVTTTRAAAQRTTGLLGASGSAGFAVVGDT